ncbi:hypothetical protein PSDVSF_23610 [Pseudodesulfovibrio sediminis]|uniref:Uncharacterized protein n=1 Tax=Pseudodesulfovibrio sediminis TaxID=2810563 RepID=A0ABM7P815_9BACT|nr:hypothetical protein PSDVSF_23610 [Pseudodesulfovibrio sediminis]
MKGTPCANGRSDDYAGGVCRQISKRAVPVRDDGLYQFKQPAEQQQEGRQQDLGSSGFEAGRLQKGKPGVCGKMVQFIEVPNVWNRGSRKNR